jgi:hypothetical protein
VEVVFRCRLFYLLKTYNDYSYQLARFCMVVQSQRFSIFKLNLQWKHKNRISRTKGGKKTRKTCKKTVNHSD